MGAGQATPPLATSNIFERITLQMFLLANIFIFVNRAMYALLGAVHVRNRID